MNIQENPTSAGPIIRRGISTKAVIGVAAIVGVGLIVWQIVDTVRQSPSHRVSQLIEQREALDQSVWADEVQAQRFEKVFVRLWDSLRVSVDPLTVLANWPLRSVTLGVPMSPTKLGLGVEQIKFAPPDSVYTQGQWAALIGTFHEQGYRLVESEWHHAEFHPSANGSPRSIVSMTLHVEQPETKGRIILRGKLDVLYDNKTIGGDGLPVVTEIMVRDLVVLTRTGETPFVRSAGFSSEEGEMASCHPILAYDLDADGQTEILIPRWNRRMSFRKGRWQRDELVAHPVPIWEAAVIADLDGDGRADLFTINKHGEPILYQAGENGKFPTPPRVCGSVRYILPTSITAGDVDGDGDLDLFTAQYKLSYEQGQMPSPIYDANDGYPSYLLLNDGRGNFTDATQQANLAAKQLRRTYSSSFVDLDDDADLDLVVVSDYCGIDLYTNDGAGHFTDVSDAWLSERHTFGMGLAFPDLNSDGQSDLYAIGMSSTTARRLEQMGLAPAARPDVTKMRSVMGYGNRAYLSVGGRYSEPPFADQLARTGWSWGVSSLDFDNDGDDDIYVANGHRSGKSCEDYCTQFWRHDIYSGGSKPDPSLAIVFSDSLKQLNARQMSWNGFEHNVLFMNVDGRQFVNVAFLMGVGFEYDSRAVIGNDFNGDGKPDLIVTQSQFDGQGYITDVHVYENRLQTDNHWIGVRLQDAGSGKSPHGAKVTLVTAQGKRRKQIVSGDSFLAQHSARVHFGLGAGDTAVERIEVVWPDQTVTIAEQPEVDRYHTIRGD